MLPLHHTGFDEFHESRDEASCSRVYSVKPFLVNAVLPFANQLVENRLQKLEAEISDELVCSTEQLSILKREDDLVYFRSCMARWPQCRHPVDPDTAYHSDLASGELDRITIMSEDDKIEVLETLELWEADDPSAVRTRQIIERYLGWDKMVNGEDFLEVTRKRPSILANISWVIDYFLFDTMLSISLPNKEEHTHLQQLLTSRRSTISMVHNVAELFMESRTYQEALEIARLDPKGALCFWPCFLGELLHRKYPKPEILAGPEVNKGVSMTKNTTVPEVGSQNPPLGHKERHEASKNPPVWPGR